MRPIVSFSFLGLAGAVALLFSAITQGSFGEQPDAATQSVDKSRYNLFNPPPCGQLRAFAPARPDHTEGPFTTHPGHLHREVGLSQSTSIKQPQRFSDIRIAGSQSLTTAT